MFPLFVDIYVKIFFNVVHVQEHAPCILYYLATFIIRKVFFIKPISYKIYVFILDNMRIDTFVFSFLLYSSYILSWSTSDHFMNEWNESTHLDVEMFWCEEKSLKFVVKHICF